MAYSEEEKIYESGYLYAYTKDLNEEEIRGVIEKAICPILERNIKLEINVVKNRNDIFLGFSYLRTPESDVFNLLINKNPDGTSRTKYIENPDYVDGGIAEDMGWGATVSAEILVDEPPLFEFEKIKDYLITIEPSFYIDKGEQTNILFCPRVPKWISDEDLKSRFEDYEKDKRKHTHKKEKFTYPIIERNNEFCKIIFSPSNPHTARFVANMVKKIYFNYENKNVLLLFNLFYKQKRCTREQD